MRCSHWPAAGRAVDAAGVQKVKAAAWVQAAAALPAVTQAAVLVLYQRLAWPQNAALAQHTNCLAHWKHTQRTSGVTSQTYMHLHFTTFNWLNICISHYFLPKYDG